MSKRTIKVFIIAMLFILSGCNTVDPHLLGEWKSEDGKEILIFDVDGVTWSTAGTKEESTYSARDGEIQTEVFGTDNNSQYLVDLNSLYLTIDGTKKNFMPMWMWEQNKQKSEEVVVDGNTNCTYGFDNKLFSELPGEKLIMSYDTSDGIVKKIHVNNELGSFTSDCSALYFENEEGVYGIAPQEEIHSLTDFIKTHQDDLNDLSIQIVKKNAGIGEEWIISPSNGTKALLESTNEIVKTEAGTYKTSKILIYQSENISKEGTILPHMVFYYAEGVGIVKTILNSIYTSQGEYFSQKDDEITLIDIEPY